jgi:putative tryptophan/tyrosine transport system substrate-binding protein
MPNRQGSFPASRREFITLLGGAATAWPLAARAQQSGRMRRLGVLMSSAEDDPVTRARLAGLRQGLERRGWTEGRNVHIDYRYASPSTGPSRVIARELAALRPDVIFAHGTQTAANVQQEAGTTPIVFVSVSDPIGSGFIVSLARPGGNMTGLLLYEASITGKWLAMLKEIAPNLTRAALIGYPKVSPYDYYLQAAKALVPQLGIELVPSPVETPADTARVVESFAQVPNGGLVVLPGGSGVQRETAVALAARYGLPAVFDVPRFCHGRRPHVLRHRSRR